MSQARPKPWEVSSGTSSATAALPTEQLQATATGVSGPSNLPATTLPTQTTTTPTDEPPAVPARPEGLQDAYGSYGTTGYGTTGYGTTGSGYGTGYGTGYGSRYGSGFGSGLYGGGMYGSSMYGSGMYGSGMYGGGMYGSGMYGSGMYGSGMYGSGLGGGLGGLAQGTEQTFQLIESCIGAVAGFSQMLESTYYATHNSFFTMMTVAEQLANLKQALGSVIGIYALGRWIKKILGKLKLAKQGFSVEEFEKFKALPEDSSSAPSTPHDKKGRISLKPLLFFLAAVFGMPYLLKKLVATMAEQQEKKLLHDGAQPPLNLGRPGEAIDPKKLEFARSLYNFNPEDDKMELALKKGDLVAILSKNSPTGEPSQWWRCRSRDGRIGFVPYNYLEMIKRASGGDRIESVEPAASNKST